MDPQAILSMLMAQNPNFNSNPMISNALNLYNSGNTDGLKQIAENLARQKGVDINAIKRQITNCN